jgi:cytochrome c oxidase assembly protein subunit 15
MAADPLVNLAPLLRILALGAVIALAPLGWIAWRHAQGHPVARWRALAVLTLVLTFDLVLFGAFTRLTDSGLGCPDWPGCYGSASPHGAQAQIDAAQSAMPTGPVTQRKAWVEMIHRYLATAVGALVTVLCIAAWWRRPVPAAALGNAGAGAPRAPPAPSPAPAPSRAWATLTLVWVCLQGAFGALTVTMKLYPAIVTAHLLGGLGLLVLLAGQVEFFQPQRLALSPRLRAAVAGLVVLALAQVALGGWVSTNYAVLACTDFPTCHGRWWPQMDFHHGFTLLRPLGRTADGAYLPFAALTAIHYAHRLMAYAVLAALVALAVALGRQADAAARRFAAGLALIAAWQLASGLSNVVLGWPLAGAVAHTAGAAALTVLLTRLMVRSRARALVRAPSPAGGEVRLAS